MRYAWVCLTFQVEAPTGFHNFRSNCYYFCLLCDARHNFFTIVLLSLVVLWSRIPYWLLTFSNRGFVSLLHFLVTFPTVYIELSFRSNILHFCATNIVILLTQFYQQHFLILFFVLAILWSFGLILLTSIWLTIMLFSILFSKSRSLLLHIESFKVEITFCYTLYRV